MTLTQQKLIELLEYNPDTGLFVWLNPRRGIAGTRTYEGYCRIVVRNKAYYGHRLAWLYVTGRLPTHTIDHINLDRMDNRWSNLREATSRENLCNTKTRIHNKSGVKGVQKHRRKWVARITVNRNLIRLGSYDTPEEAHSAYCNAAKKHNGEYARFE